MRIMSDLCRAGEESDTECEEIIWDYQGQRA